MTQTRTERREYERNYHLQRRYGISSEQYDEMLKRQDHKCKICGSENPKGNGNRFAVDHCHSSNRVRGLLCQECNQGLGKFNDDISLLSRAITYLNDKESD